MFACRESGGLILSALTSGPPLINLSGLVASRPTLRGGGVSLRPPLRLANGNLRPYGPSISWLTCQARAFGPSRPSVAPTPTQPPPPNPRPTAWSNPVVLTRTDKPIKFEIKSAIKESEIRKFKDECGKSQRD